MSPASTRALTSTEQSRLVLIALQAPPIPWLPTSKRKNDARFSMWIRASSHMEGALPGGREAEDEPRSCLVLDRQTGHGQSVAVSPGAAGARKVFKVYGGGQAEDDWTAERYCVCGQRISVSSSSGRTLQLGSWGVGAMARRRWLRCRLVVTRPVEFHGGRAGGARGDVPEAVCASSNVGRCTQLACQDGRNPLTESVASLNMSFSGLELPKWPSLRQLPLATVRW